MTAWETRDKANNIRSYIVPVSKDQMHGRQTALRALQSCEARLYIHLAQERQAENVDNLYLQSSKPKLTGTALPRNVSEWPPF